MLRLLTLLLALGAAARATPGATAQGRSAWARGGGE
jgi:hypothetical protein